MCAIFITLRYINIFEYFNICIKTDRTFTPNWFSVVKHDVSGDLKQKLII